MAKWMQILLSEISFSFLRIFQVLEVDDEKFESELESILRAAELCKLFSLHKNQREELSTVSRHKNEQRRRFARI